MRVPWQSLRAMFPVGEGGAGVSLLFAMAVVCVTMIYWCKQKRSKLEAAAPAGPAMLPTEEQAAKRTAQLERLATLPEHLRLGVTLPGMRELLSELPGNAVKQVNAKIPLDKVTGNPKFPKNRTVNGYVYQFFITKWAKEDNGYITQYFTTRWAKGDNLAVCERLQKRGSPHVGKATVFVSWFLETPIDTLLDALANFLKEKGLREEDTFFWVCDYVIRQTNVGPDLALLGDCVSAVGHTVLLMEPWDAPAPLKRAYCIKEVYYTQESGAQFDVVMSSAQQAAFEVALVGDLGSIETSLSKVDVRTAVCRNADDTKAILDELEQGVGFTKCNTLVIGLLREALVAQARAALGQLPAAERGTSALISNLAVLLEDMGQLEEAKPLYEEALRERRKTLGNRHPRTLNSISNMGLLLKAMGKLEEARPLYEEALQAKRETLCDRDPSTLTSINNMGPLRGQGMGQLEEARPLLEEALQARRETLSDRHPDTLASISIMGGLLQDMGQLEEARPLHEEALQAQRETLSDRHPDTLASISNMGLLLQDMGKLEEARPLYEEALQGRRETLGDRHPSTLASISNMGELLQDMGKLEEARPLCEEALQGRRETLGDCHPSTLTSISNMGGLLRAMGKLEEAKPLYEEALQAQRTTLGDRHPDTLVTISNMGGLLRAMGKLEEARPLYEEALQAMRETLGNRHLDTLASINHMGQLLQDMGKLEEARPLYEEALQARRETLGDRHPSTLLSMNSMGWLLQGMGQLEEARPFHEEAVQASMSEAVSASLFS